LPVSKVPDSSLAQCYAFTHEQPFF
jgi:hypothetical protein